MKAFSKGYTIIELLIVLIITALLLTTGYSQFRSFSQRQEVAVARRQIEGDLRKIQSEALAGRKPSGCLSLDGYAFEITVAIGTPLVPPQYELYALCNSPLSVKLDAKTVYLPANLNLTPVPSVNPILFRPFTLGTNLSTFAEINIKLDSNNSSIIFVSQNGEIK